MDEPDLSLFGKKDKKNKDKADAMKLSSKAEGAKEKEREPESKTKDVVISRPTFKDTYENCKYAGVALIFNHKEVKNQKTRTGTERDRDKMKETLRALGFDVWVYDELSFEEINRELLKASKLDHSENDCFVLVVMSHGDEGKVYAKDMAYPVDRLWKYFLGDSCKTLVDKPKLFFIQACRGNQIEKTVQYSVMSRDVGAAEQKINQPEVFAIPSTADLLVYYSTFEKSYSFRNVDDGSWFIQTLCSVLDATAVGKAAQPEGIELLQVLTTVNRRVAYEYQSNNKKEAFNEKKEMPNFMSTLTKHFRLRVKSPRLAENKTN